MIHRTGDRLVGVALALLFLLAAGPSSAADLREGVEQLAAQLAKSAPEQKQTRLAVTDFPDLQGVVSDLGRYVAERLTTRLSQNPKFSIIERRRLGQVLKELKFGMSDLVDPVRAKQLGRMLGVETLVVGSVSDLGNVVDIDARIIEIETNRMMPGASVTISKDQTVKDMMDRGRAGALGSAPSATPSPRSSSAPDGPAPTVSAGGFTFEPRGCRQVTTFHCVVAITNITDNSRDVMFHGMSLVDDLGNEYVAQVYIGNQTLPFGGYTFVPRLPINVRLHTQGKIDVGARTINAVVNISGIGGPVIVRNIQITR